MWQALDFALRRSEEGLATILKTSDDRYTGTHHEAVPNNDIMDESGKGTVVYTTYIISE